MGTDFDKQKNDNGNNKLSCLASSAASLLGSLKATARIARLHAQIKKIQLFDLREAYRVVGTRMFELRLFTEEFADRYAALTTLDAAVADKRRPVAIDENATLTEKAKAKAMAGKRLAEVEVLLHRRKNLLEVLGKDVIDTNLSAEQIQPAIGVCRRLSARLTELDSAVSTSEGRRISKRLVLAAAGCLCLGVIYYGYHSISGTPKKQRVMAMDVTPDLSTIRSNVGQAVSHSTSAWKAAEEESQKRAQKIDREVKLLEGRTRHERTQQRTGTEIEAKQALLNPGTTEVPAPLGSERHPSDAESKEKKTLTLKGHSSGVLSVAFSPDGKRIASGGMDRAVKVWDATNGHEILSLAHGGTVFSVAFSPDGKLIVTGNGDHTVKGGDNNAAKVWDAASGQMILSLNDTGPVLSVAFSPDGKRIATGDGDKRAKVWDATTGQEILTLQGQSSIVTSVAFSPDGKWIATGSLTTRIGKGSIKVWDAASGQESLALNGENSVAFSPDGGRIVTRSEDNKMGSSGK